MSLDFIIIRVFWCHNVEYSWGSQTMYLISVLKIINIDSKSLACEALIHITTTNGSNHLIINSFIAGHSIQFMLDMILPVSHVI